MIKILFSSGFRKCCLFERKGIMQTINICLDVLIDTKTVIVMWFVFRITNVKMTLHSVVKKLRFLIKER